MSKPHLIEDMLSIHKKPSKKKKEPEIPLDRDFDYREYEPEPRKRTRLSILFWIFIFSVVIALIYFLLNIFSSVKITLSPRVDHFSLTEEAMSASHDPSASLHFELMIVDGDEKKHVILTDLQTVETKAAGTVVLYNKFSTKPQSLAINTRLTDDNGKIYLTDKALSIPGYTIANKAIVPGSIEAGIHALVAGEKYNGSPSDFNVLGFKGTAKYEKIYGRGKGNIEGGMTGSVYNLDPKSYGEAFGDMKSKLSVKLQTKINAQIPPNYILYPGSLEFTQDTPPTSVQSKTSDAVVGIHGTLSGILIPKDELVKKIAKLTVPDISDAEMGEVDIPEIKSLSFAYSPADFQISKNVSSLNFTLSGEGNLLWHPQIEKLKSSISGMKKTDLDPILKSDRAISKASLSFRPPWSAYVPSDLSKIHIEVK